MAGRQAPVISGLGAVITLVSVSCLLLALWRLTSDLGWTESFAISEGFLSHWQVWMALTIAFGALGLRLKRFGQTELAESVPSAADFKPAQEIEAEDLLGPRVS